MHNALSLYSEQASNLHKLSLINTSENMMDVSNKQGEPIEKVMADFIARDSIATQDLRLNTEQGDCLGEEYDMLFPSISKNQEVIDMSMASFKSVADS